MGNIVAGIRITTITGLVACLALASPACSNPEQPADDAQRRLESLGSAWLAKPASVTYRTFERDSGEAMSTHQCLRQFAGGTVDRQTAIRLCSGEGRLTFMQDPPTRWRMDVNGADASFTLISTPDGSFRCPPRDDGSSCTVASEDDASTRFVPIVRRPDEVLDEMGIVERTVTRIADRTIAGLHAECFSVASSVPEGELGHAEWCYSEASVLLSFAATTDAGSSTILEAVEISSVVPVTAFDVPSISGVDGGTRPSDVTAISGTWVFDAITGVAPSLLPNGAVPDNRHGPRDPRRRHVPLG